MNQDFSPQGGSLDEALRALEPGMSTLMYEDAACTQLVAEICRSEDAYYVAGPRFASPMGLHIGIFVHTNTVGHYNHTRVDEQEHIYRCATPAEASEKLVQLFKWYNLSEFLADNIS